MIRTFAIAAAGLFAASGAALSAQDAAPPKIDYSNPDTWLCRPGKTAGACVSDQSATEVAPDGSVRPVSFSRPADPPFDCFWLYPTSSEDPGAFSDLTPGREVNITTTQFGRYGVVCRQFAPLYRSATLASLTARSRGTPMETATPNLNYDDVVDAWNHYLQHDNNGRGVILVGHSQGASLITRLVQNEIEGKPAQGRLIAIHSLGTTVQVPPGQDMGGSYKSIPLCRRADQFGCVIVYASYRSTLPPSVDPPARFGRARDEMVAACVNPAALAGGGAALDTFQSRGSADWAPGKTIETPFVRLPNLARGECVTRGEYSYLEITPVAGPDNARRNVITGDIGGANPDPTWGLHNGDFPVAMGDLVRLAESQGRAWLAANGRANSALPPALPGRGGPGR